ncbi:hypothetical protein MAPG_04762 [Magnaporthiopsis poae ATCC 64411]|uniref:Uncharacterized protein n=1 Tax=Magnaporthiopsis poae (strain ATCC 64411 / 73-15) TaxID=644358 RepID=A0A0C4DXK8_MAGP6|nr:hypothetical protein MAPG_04762 [Magnaporthiopsis poae ATCC 64411]
MNHEPMPAKPGGRTAVQASPHYLQYHSFPAERCPDRSTAAIVTSEEVGPAKALPLDPKFSPHQERHAVSSAAICGRFPHHGRWPPKLYPQVINPRLGRTSSTPGWRVFSLRRTKVFSGTDLCDTTAGRAGM